MTATARIALTAGEPAGIGPDLCVQLAQRGHDCELVCLADRDVLAARARQLGLPLKLRDYDRAGAPQPTSPGELPVLHLPCAAPVRPGVLEPANAAQVLAMLTRAARGALDGEFAAVVTAPVQKSVLNSAGLSFSGHTEFFAAQCGVALPVMLLIAGRLRVALATTHVPLAAVPAAVTFARLVQILEVLDR
ncbi:MAG: 4-hydroxythreonine-4-phosphate dehydrogenase PdxA, partial [Steroidobacteraceae bacterium]|nr:4-hydroxythreonine-4-phosphate dehydrogenase PdxA [Steroidobacteraceae bacterium]